MRGRDEPRLEGARRERDAGPHPLLVEILVDRLAEAGLRPEDSVVLARYAEA